MWTWRLKNLNVHRTCWLFYKLQFHNTHKCWQGYQLRLNLLDEYRFAWIPSRLNVLLNAFGNFFLLLPKRLSLFLLHFIISYVWYTVTNILKITLLKRLGILSLESWEEKKKIKTTVRREVWISFTEMSIFSSNGQILKKTYK